ncbi:MAG: hypothetical protein JW748_14740 [Anaerolineales bacterium]|nr:hypothetical protein [Anaerolineales bacterium]
MNEQPNNHARILWLPPALLLVFACNLGGIDTQQPADIKAGSTSSPTAGLSAKESPEVPVAPSETAAVLTSTLTPTFTIIHLTTPPGAAGTTRYITDFDTKPYAPQKKAIGGDEYHNNRWERPFTSGEMEYLSDVDLKRVEMKIAAPWVYVTFEFLDPRAEGIGETMYGAEFDLNKDGRGDYLIWGASPADGEWTTDGVEVWKDTNFDVGGPTPQGANAPWNGGDGYDKNLFASGVGDDPDLAWIRQIEGGKKAQLAFKYSVLNNAAQFLWNGVADLGIRNPAWMDYNDHFTQEKSGSPLPVQTALYPLKEMWGLDNTCRDAYGFTPAGTEAGLCLYYGTIRGVIFRDYHHANPASMTDNGIRDANEPVYPHGEVRLGQGACPSSGYKSASIGASGEYAFADLPIGTYCVRHLITFPVDYYRTSPAEVTVTLTPGEVEVVNFGVDWMTQLI